MASSFVQLQMWLLNNVVGSLQFTEPTRRKQFICPLWSSPRCFLAASYKKKKKTSYSDREIRKRKIQNFGLLPLTGCFTKSCQPQRAEVFSCFKTSLEKKKKIYKSMLTWVLLKKHNIHVMIIGKLAQTSEFVSCLFCSWTSAPKARQLSPPLLSHLTFTMETTKHTDWS